MKKEKQIIYQQSACRLIGNLLTTIEADVNEMISLIC